MDAIHLTGRITESGKLEFDLPPDLDLEPGQVRITIEPLDPNSDQAWFWTPEWQAGEHEADEDIREGRVKRFNSMTDLIDDLASGSVKHASGA